MEKLKRGLKKYKEQNKSKMDILLTEVRKMVKQAREKEKKQGNFLQVYPIEEERKGKIRTRQSSAK